MIKLSFEYSKKYELERIKNTINRIDWYTNNNYSLDLLSFPKDINPGKLKSVSDMQISEAVEKEYDEGKFQSTAESLKQMLEKYTTKIEKFIGTINVPIIPDIKVYLTNYGIGGSYSLPNEVIVNTSRFFSVGLLRNVLHEIIHLHIQYLIDKYKIGQWEKEAIVNLLFERAFPEIYKENKSPITTDEIKRIFNENFPCIEKIIHLIQPKAENI